MTRVRRNSDFPEPPVPGQVDPERLTRADPDERRRTGGAGPPAHHAVRVATDCSGQVVEVDGRGERRGALDLLTQWAERSGQSLGPGVADTVGGEGQVPVGGVQTCPAPAQQLDDGGAAVGDDRPVTRDDDVDGVLGQGLRLAVLGRDVDR